MGDQGAGDADPEQQDTGIGQDADESGPEGRMWMKPHFHKMLQTFDPGAFPAR